MLKITLDPSKGKVDYHKQLQASLLIIIALASQEGIDVPVVTKAESGIVPGKDRTPLSDLADTKAGKVIGMPTDTGSDSESEASEEDAAKLKAEAAKKKAAEAAAKKKADAEAAAKKKAAEAAAKKKAAEEEEAKEAEKGEAEEAEDIEITPSLLRGMMTPFKGNNEFRDQFCEFLDTVGYASITAMGAANDTEAMKKTFDWFKENSPEADGPF